MKITVITVCRNAQKEIAKTISSVLTQEYEDIEYIIVDGASTDGTCEVVKKAISGQDVTFISEPDKGLYDAMNKGIELSRGDYLIFMNAGDEFLDSKVTGDFADKLDCDIVYGNAVRVRDKEENIEGYKGIFKELRLFLCGRMMCHQAMFIKASVLKKYKYDLDYKITADFNFAVKVYALGYKYKYIDRTVCRFDNTDGLSSRISNNDIMRAEDDKTLKQYLPVWFYLISIPKGIVRCFKRSKERKKV